MRHALLRASDATYHFESSPAEAFLEISAEPQVAFFGSKSTRAGMTSRSMTRPGIIVGLFAILAIAGAAAFWILGSSSPSDAQLDRTVHEPAPKAASWGNLNSAPASTASAASSGAAVPATRDAAAVPAENTSEQDQRMIAKITRGLSSYSGGGILVEEIYPGSVVAELALEPGDVIRMLNGEVVASPEDLARIYRSKGLPHQVEIIRNGRVLHRH